MAFTDPVLESIDYLRKAIDDIRGADPDGAETLTAITDDLVVNLENQMMLVFANVGAKTKAAEAELLRSRANMSYLEQYREACGDAATLELDDDGRLHVKEHGEAHAAVTPLPANVPLSYTDPSVQRTLLSALHVTLEAIGDQLKAERTVLYLCQRGTGTLRIVASAPDVAPAKKGLFLASHQGIPGSVLSTGIAVRADRPNTETRRTIIDPVDATLGFKTRNVMAFPILDRVTRQPIAVLECANKATSFCERDEATMKHAAELLQYSLVHYGVDFHNGMHFNPSALHAVRPFIVEGPSELKGFMDAENSQSPQLIVRLRSEKTTGGGTVVDSLAHTLGLTPEEGDLPPAATTKGTHMAARPENAYEVSPAGSIREVATYLEQVETSHRTLMTDLVAAQAREAQLREDLHRKTGKVRVLEENTTALQEQLLHAQTQMNEQSFSPIITNNAAEFDASGSAAAPRIGASVDGAAAKGSPRTGLSLPPIRPRPNRSCSTPEPSDPVAQAALLIRELQAMQVRDPTAAPPPLPGRSGVPSTSKTPLPTTKRLARRRVAL